MTDYPQGLKCENCSYEKIAVGRSNYYIVSQGSIDCTGTLRDMTTKELSVALKERAKAAAPQGQPKEE